MPNLCTYASQLTARVFATIDIGSTNPVEFRKWIKSLWKMTARFEWDMRQKLRDAWRHRGGPAFPASAIFRRIGEEFPFGRLDNGVDMGMDALRGLFRILELDGIEAHQRQRIIYALFNRNWLVNSDDLIKFLRLVRETFDAFSTPELQKGLRKILISIAEPNSIDGAWYHLEWMRRRGFAMIDKIEGVVDVDLPTRRGVDIALKPPNRPRFFELKNELNYTITSGEFDLLMRELTGPLVSNVNGGWRMFRINFNGDKLDLARAGVNSVEEYIRWNGGRFFSHLLRNGPSGSVPTNIYQGYRRLIRDHLRTFDANFDFAAFLDRVGDSRNWARRSAPDHLSVLDKKMFDRAKQFMGDNIMEDMTIPNLGVTRDPPGTRSNFTV